MPRLRVFKRLICPSIVAPRRGEGVPHCNNVSAQCAGEPLNREMSRLLRILQPGAKLCNIFALQNPAKSHGQLAHRSEVGPSAFQRVNLRLLTVCQQPARLKESAAATIGEINRPVAGSTVAPRQWRAPAAPPWVGASAISPASSRGSKNFHCSRGL